MTIFHRENLTGTWEFRQRADVAAGPSRLDQVVQQGDISRLEFFPADELIKVYTKAFVLVAAEKTWILSDVANRC